MDIKINKGMIGKNAVDNSDAVKAHSSSALIRGMKFFAIANSGKLITSSMSRLFERDNSWTIRWIANIYQILVSNIKGEIM